jgi:hypothetical protein
MNHRVSLVSCCKPLVAEPPPAAQRLNQSAFCAVLPWMISVSLRGMPAMNSWADAASDRHDSAAARASMRMSFILRFPLAFQRTAPGVDAMSLLRNIIDNIDRVAILRSAGKFQNTSKSAMFYCWPRLLTCRLLTKPCVAIGSRPASTPMAPSDLSHPSSTRSSAKDLTMPPQKEKWNANPP